MKLYYAPGACSMADHIVLEWIGKPYTTEKMDKASMKSPRYLAINPNGAVPALERDDGGTLTQNAAILNYLADKFPDAKLGGDGTPEGRAEVNRWLSHLNADVHTTFHPLFGMSAFVDDETAIAKIQAHAREKLRTMFENIDKHLAGKEWLAGSRSIADPYLFVVLRWAKAMKVDLSGLDHLAKFFERMASDAAVHKVMAEEGVG